MAAFFGLNINNNLTDILDSASALKNLNLDIKDLDRIKGVTQPGNVNRADFRTLSGLAVDIEKVSGALASETSLYDNLTDTVYNENSFIDNNLIVQGQVAASNIKYKYLDTNNAETTSDISTSRTSAWSTFENPSSLVYGGVVDLEGPLKASQLNLAGPAAARRFSAEIPTHKIKVIIDGAPVYLYAMKGIPLVFNGFFRNANLLARITATSVNNVSITPSWTITDRSTGRELVFSGQRDIFPRDTAAKEREVKFFYPPDRITLLSIPGIALSSMPNTSLTNLTFLDVNSNDLREIFDLRLLYPNLRTLRLQYNNLTRGSRIDLKTLSNSVVDKLPTTLTELYIGNCYSGVCTADFSALPLTILNIDAGTRTNRRLTGISPSVNSSIIETYNVSVNLFENISETVKSSTSLKNLDISYNDMPSVTDMRFDSTELESFASISNRHNLVDVANKPKLRSYTFFSYGLIPGNRTVTNIFNGCTALETINIDVNTPVNGPIPAFVGCVSLKTIRLYTTEVSDAIPATAGNVANVLGPNTLDACRDTLTDFRIRSSKFSPTGEFDPDCFKSMTALSYLEILSDKSGISGPLPKFTSARNIRYIIMYSNNLSGSIAGSFNNNEKLFYVHLANNFFTGAVPNIPHQSLQHLILTNNLLSEFNAIDSVGLLRLQLSVNNLTNIPDLSNLTQLQELLINNQRVDRVTYTAGSFSTMTNIRILNASNNGMTQGSIDTVIKDLVLNYIARPRTGVYVNLSGNSSPSSSTEIQDAITQLRAGGWTIQTN